MEFFKRNFMGFFRKGIPRCKISLRCDEGILSPHMQSFLSNVHSACFGGSPNTLPIGRTDFYAQCIKRRSFMQGCAFWGHKNKSSPIFFSGYSHFYHPHLFTTSFSHKYINFAHFTGQKSHFLSARSVL